jgi:hypothetical protein
MRLIWIVTASAVHVLQRPLERLVFFPALRTDEEVVFDGFQAFGKRLAVQLPFGKLRHEGQTLLAVDLAVPGEPDQPHQNFKIFLGKWHG